MKLPSVVYSNRATHIYHPESHCSETHNETKHTTNDSQACFVQHFSFSRALMAFTLHIHCSKHAACNSHMARYYLRIPCTFKFSLARPWWCACVALHWASHSAVHRTSFNYNKKNIRFLVRSHEVLEWIYTYLPTPWCRVLLEQLTGLQLVKKYPAFHGTRRFITALTSVRHLSLSWASPIQSIYLHPTSWRSILILSTHLRLGLPSGLFPSGFPTRTLYTPSPHRMNI